MKKVSAAVMEMIRKEDVLCRYGGEEFALVLRNTAPEMAYVLRDSGAGLLIADESQAANGGAAAAEAGIRMVTIGPEVDGAKRLDGAGGQPLRTYASRRPDDVAVMQHGRIVEQGPAAQVLTHPQQAYTKALLDAAPGRGWDFANFRPVTEAAE